MSERLTKFAQQVADEEVQSLRAEVARLRLAIRRLADQDATLSVCDGNVTVTMDATLTDAERDVIEWCQQSCSRARTPQGDRLAAALRGLLERTEHRQT